MHKTIRCWWGPTMALAFGFYVGCSAGEAGDLSQGDLGSPGGGRNGAGAGAGGGLGGTGGLGGAGGGGGTPAKGNCIADRVTPPKDAKCTCTCKDCDCTALDCVCDKSCYQANVNTCLINSDSAGNGRTGTGWDANCGKLTCVPENDLTKELRCSVSTCQFNPNQVQLTPQVAPNPQSIDVNRQVRNAGMIFTVDTSSSMEPKQMASACAAQSFVDAAGNAQWTLGVMTQDITRWYSGGVPAMPSLLQVTGGCSAPLTCQCPGSASGDVCTFSPGGTMLTSQDPNAVSTLQKLLVQGSNENSNSDEAGLEKAFLYVLGLYKAGRQSEVGQVVAVSDESPNDDNRICNLQANRDINHIKSIVGAGFNPPPNTGNCDQDLTNFYVAFFTFTKVQVNALCNLDQGSSEYGKIYLAVAAATNGFVADLADCAKFREFFTKVGVSTNTLSTQVCLGQALDPATVTVVYTGDGSNTTVPQSATDGWTYDTSLKCVIFHGSWQTKYGGFQIRYPGASQPTSKVCLPKGTNAIESTIKVSVKGVSVPKSSTDGWTYDAAAECLTFHGTWQNNPGPFDVQYF